MKPWITKPAMTFVLTLLLASASVGDPTAVGKGDILPSFRLPTITGGTLTHADLAGSTLAVLYFFSNSCKPCVTGLRDLTTLAAESRSSGLLVVGIGKQKLQDLKSFAQTHGLDSITIAAGDAQTLSRFNATHIFPTIYIIGPERKVLETMQGGGASARKTLAALAQGQFQRRAYASAEELYRTLAYQPNGDPRGADAQVGLGYAQLRGGKHNEAKATFQVLADSSDREVALKGGEGLASTLVESGDPKAAAAVIDNVIEVAPERGPAQLIKGKVLRETGKHREARRHIELAAAADSVHDFGWQKAEARYALGNVLRENNQLRAAVTAYQEAVQEDPYLIEALSNQGVTLQELGQPEEAVKAFNAIKRVDPHDPLVASLLRQAQEAIAQKQDLEKRQRVNELVDQLTQQYRVGQQQQAEAPQDDWTTPVIAMALLPFDVRGTTPLMARAGTATVLREELTRELQALNIRVVDRILLDQLLGELKLGASEIADPDTALRLGRILAARLMATGSFFSTSEESLVTLRLVDTETTGIVLPVSDKRESTLDPSSVATKLAKAIADVIREQYPLRGRIALVEEDQVIINLGRKHGVTPGMVFNVLGECQTIELNGRVLGCRENKLGRVEIVKAEELMAYARTHKRKGSWQKNQRIISQYP